MATNAKEEKLASVRARIKMLREVLSDPSLMTEIAIDGLSEKVNRADLRAELKELEEEEARLSGSTSRLYGIKLN